MSKPDHNKEERVSDLIVGIHPYADEFPMASEDELDALAENIAAVGLIQAVVITPDGLVLDGRNRIEACKRAAVEIHTVTRNGSDDDYKEFVIGVNTTGRRESMTVQIAAASTALVLGEVKRKDGRWKYGERLHKSVQSQPRSERNELSKCGLILDTLGRDALREVRDGKESLNAVYERAVDFREEERLERERQEQQAAEEAAAKTFVEEHDPELAAEVGGALLSYVEAKAVWEQRNREEAAALRKEEAMRVAARAAELSAWGKACDGLLAALSYAASTAPPKDTDRYPAVDVFTERYKALGNHMKKWSK